MQNISIDISDDSSIDSEDNISLEENNNNFFLIIHLKNKMITYLSKFYNFFIIFLNLFLKLLIFFLIFTIIIMIGRYVCYVLEIVKHDFWFKYKEPYSIWFFISFGLLGFLILFCSIAFLLACCCSNSEEDY